MSICPQADSAQQSGAYPRTLPPPAILRAVSFREAALAWYDFGYEVLPLIPGSKMPAVKWADGWPPNRNRRSIDSYWRANPTHGVGCLLGDRHIVFDTDSPEASAALYAAEAASGAKPMLIVRTTRGEHHHFRRAVDLVVASASFCTATQPARVDILTGRHLAGLPPSGGKRIVVTGTCLPQHADELTFAPQALVDALIAGGTRKEAPTAGPRRLLERDRNPGTRRAIEACLDRLNPDLHYSDWFKIAAVIHNTLGDSEDEYRLFDRWSSQGVKYQSERETRKLWSALDFDHPHPSTIGTLRAMLKAQRLDWVEICAEAEDDFEQISKEGV